MLQRKSSLVDRAFWNFLGASILTTVAAQLAVSTDAAIVSHLMGPHAMAAVNMAMPVLTTFLSLNSLLGVGASLLAAKAIGSRDSEEASRIFSAALYSVLAVGVVVTALSYTFCEQISHVVCADESIRPMVLSYLKVTSIGVTVLVLSGMMNMMVQSDGRPRLVTGAVIAGALTNVVLDVVFIKFLGLGIAGSAWATIINYAVTVCIVSSHLRRTSCTYRILRFGRKVWQALGANLKQGLPLMIANVLLSVIVLLINKMVDGVLGSDGVYMVAVCIQLLLITFVVLNGVLDAMFAIGGTLLGEHDTTGLKMLNRRVMTFACAILVPFTLFVAVAPGVMATLFGADSPELRGQLCRVLRIFSMILLPFSLTVLLRGMYQVLGHLVLSTAVAVGQVASIVAVVFIFTQVAAPDMLWWGFPLSAVAILAVQIFITWRMTRKSETSAFTLIPASDPISNYSATVEHDQKEAAASEITTFLHNAACADATIVEVLKFVTDALKETTGAADVCVHIGEASVDIVVKDTAKLGIAKESETKQAFGLNVRAQKVACRCFFEN